VTSTANLAGAVRGSLANAASLAADLGRWVAVTALTAACAIASLLTMAAVTRRVRDIGTLKALGWPTRRIVAQIIGESVVTGACGALAGIALGFAGAALIDAISPKLTATASATGGSSVAVRLTAHAGTGTALSAALLAMGCALVAGAAGGWRAARLQPACAFTEVA
jgi:putative ABC transport system permease protein